MKIRESISQWMENQEARWQALPRERQRKYTILLFAAYLAISVGVYLSYWYDVSSAGKTMQFRHIENPVLHSEPPIQKKDTNPHTYKR